MRIISPIILALFTFLLVYSSGAFAEEVKCDKTKKNSEFSWNPANQYVTKRLSRFYELDDKIKEAYFAHNFSTTKELISEYLELASIY